MVALRLLGVGHEVVAAKLVGEEHGEGYHVDPRGFMPSTPKGRAAILCGFFSLPSLIPTSDDVGQLRAVARWWRTSRVR